MVKFGLVSKIKNPAFFLRKFNSWWIEKSGCAMIEQADFAHTDLKPSRTAN